MTRADGSAVVAVGEVTERLTDDELDRLLEALARLDEHDADTVLEEIRALRLAGGPIRLLPNEAELVALDAALAALAGEPLGPDAILVDTADVDGSATTRRRRR